MEYEHILPDGNKIKVCDISDLMAVKSGAEAAAKNWEAEKSTYENTITELNNGLGTTKTNFEAKHQELLQLQAHNKELVDKYDNLSKSTGDIVDMRAKLTSAEESVNGLTTKLGGYLKSILVNHYKVGEDKIADKTPNELESLVSALSLTNPNGVGANMDFSSNNHSTSTPKTAYEAAAETIQKLTGGNIRVS